MHLGLMQPRPRTESRDRGSQNRTSNPHRGHAQNPAPCDRESQNRHALCRGGAHACIGLGVRTSTILSLALCLYIHIYIYIYTYIYIYICMQLLHITFIITSSIFIYNHHIYSIVSAQHKLPWAAAVWRPPHSPPRPPKRETERERQ